MTAVEPPGVERPIPLAAGSQQAPNQPRLRRTDGGPEILPCLEHFVTLARKSKQPGLVLTLVEQAAGIPLADREAWVETTNGALSVPARRALFHAVAKLGVNAQQRIERAAERIVLLDDEYGVQAVQSLLEEEDERDAQALAMADRYSRALHLFLLQEYPDAGARREHRFDHAERLQVMHRQWKSESFSSHYLGPKGIEPTIDTEVEEQLRVRIAELFPQVSAEQILIEQFTRRDLAHADRYDGGYDAKEAALVLLYTVTATFNGSTARFKQVADGEVVEHEEPAAMSACFSWEPQSGSLSVFCEDKESRRQLATIFRDVVLVCEGQINDMPMREFDLLGFSTPAMLKKIDQERVDGVETISVLQLKIGCPFEQHTTDEANGRVLVQHLSSTLLVSRDRRDHRPIYQVAYQDYGIDDLTGYALLQVKLVFRMANQPHRRAHNVAVQITSPNGLNDKSKTEDDRQRVLDQLARLGVLCEF